jgi:hypothetical protein
MDWFVKNSEWPAEKHRSAETVLKFRCFSKQCERRGEWPCGTLLDMLERDEK